MQMETLSNCLEKSNDTCAKYQNVATIRLNEWPSRDKLLHLLARFRFN